MLPDSRRRIRAAVLDCAEEIAVDCRGTENLRALAANLHDDAREVSDDLRALPRQVLHGIAAAIDSEADRLMRESAERRLPPVYH